LLTAAENRRWGVVLDLAVLADGRLVSVVNALADGATGFPLEDGRSALDVRVDARSL